MSFRINFYKICFSKSLRIVILKTEQRKFLKLWKEFMSQTTTNQPVVIYCMYVLTTEVVKCARKSTSQQQESTNAWPKHRALTACTTTKTTKLHMMTWTDPEKKHEEIRTVNECTSAVPLREKGLHDLQDRFGFSVLTVGGWSVGGFTAQQREEQQDDGLTYSLTYSESVA